MRSTPHQRFVSTARRKLANSRRAALTSLLALAALGSSGCSATRDISAWRGTHAVARPSTERSSLAEDTARVEKLRESLDLASSRRLALSLAAENPESSQALYLASRAESDEALWDGDPNACPGCGTPLAPASESCAECGLEFPSAVACARCGGVVDPSGEACAVCGAPL